MLFWKNMFPKMDALLGVHGLGLRKITIEKGAARG
jgi:hypothetical protein